MAATCDFNINNNMNNKSESYDRNTEYLLADILNVSKLEDEEQKRRMADAEGENNKRVLALNMSEMFAENTRLTWFQRGSSFVLSLIGNVRSAAATQASNLTASISNKAGDLGHKASVSLQAKAEEASILAKQQAQNLGAKAQEAAKDASQLITNKAEIAGLAVQEKAQSVSNTLAHKAEDVNLKAQQVAHDLSSQGQAAALNLAHGVQAQGLETAHNVSSFAQEKASGAKSLFVQKVNEYTQKLKDAVTLSFHKTLGSFTGRTNLTFAILEQEAERARRMNGGDEVYAIKNAMRVAALIKGLSPSLYRPAFEPNAEYSTKLLEEAERSRRIDEVKCENDKAGIDNAKAVSNLINQKFNNPEPAQFPIAKGKVEITEAQADKPFVAAM